MERKRAPVGTAGALLGDEPQADIALPEWLTGQIPSAQGIALRPGYVLNTPGLKSIAIRKLDILPTGKPN